MRSMPAIYEKILIFGREEREVSEGELPAAQIGGPLRSPNYPLSYLLAAWHTINAAKDAKHLDHVALPAAYLQRHSFELALKQLIEVAYIIHQDSQWIAALRMDSQAVRPKQLEVPWKHELDILMDTLAEALKAINYEPVPEEIVDMGQRLMEIEASVPTRLRYPKIRKHEPSLPDSVEFALEATQKDLEDLFERFFVCREDRQNSNLMTALSNECEALFQGILRLVPIDKL